MRTSGCFAISNMSVAAKRRATALASPRNKAPSGDCSKGLPALSSTEMPQRRSCDVTRAAISRSGVINAVRCPGCSSLCRIWTAMIFASCALSSASIRRTCANFFRLDGSSRQCVLRSGRQKISVMLSAIAGAAPDEIVATSSRAIAMRSSNRRKWNCGCTSALRRDLETPSSLFGGRSASQSASGIFRSTPGRITDPFGRRATRRNRLDTAIADVVIPAAIKGEDGGFSRKRCSSLPSKIFLRSAGPRSFRLASSVR